MLLMLKFSWWATLLFDLGEMYNMSSHNPDVGPVYIPDDFLPKQWIKVVSGQADMCYYTH